MNVRAHEAKRPYLIVRASMSRSRSVRIARRGAVVLAIGMVCVICLSSSLVSAVVGALTVLSVMIDVTTHARVEDHARSLDATPHKITVDLRRRS